MMKSKKTLTIICAALSALLVIATAIIIYLCYWSPVTIHGVKYSRSAHEIDISGTDISSDVSELIKLSELKHANLVNTDISIEQYEFLAENIPECDIKWSVPMGDKTYPSDTAALVLDEAIAPSELKNIKYFTKLQTLDARQYPLCEELYAITIASKDAPYESLFQTTLCGKELTNDTRKLDISDMEIDDISDFYPKLRFFQNLEEVYCGNCKVSDEDMDKLNTSLPDTKIVWQVEFAKWQVRTDIKVFSTLVGDANPNKYYDDVFYPLLNYCTDLVALDLGHNFIEDINSFSKLNNLEILCLCDTLLTNLEGIEKLQKLHYIELFGCKQLLDVAPLAKLPDLQEAELQCSGKLRNLAALKGCKKLKMLFISHSWDNQCSAEELAEALPDCWVSTMGIYPATSGWRSTEKNQKIKTAFTNWKKIISYNGWEDVEYQGRITREPIIQPLYPREN